MDRYTRWTLVGVAVLVVVAIAVVRLPGPATPPDLATPDGVATAWFAALDAGRPETAWDLLDPRTQAKETRDEFLRRHPSASNGGHGGSRIRFEAVEVTGDEARVEVSRSYGMRGDFPFWPSTIPSKRLVVRLRLVEGQWRVVSAPEYP